MGGRGAAQVGRTETHRQTDRENIQCSYDHLKYLGFIVLSQNYDFFLMKCKHFRRDLEHSGWYDPRLKV